eukprot:SAG22_NODE_1299_length_4809_cov_3.052866_3_plen_99_part_00
MPFPFHCALPFLDSWWCFSAAVLLFRSAGLTGGWAVAFLQVCHSRTKDIPAIVRRADIVIAAIGKPHFVQGDWLKPGCVVIDVGINDIPDASKKRGYR